jgi:hypothetical protein
VKTSVVSVPATMPNSNPTAPASIARICVASVMQQDYPVNGSDRVIAVQVR